MSKEILTQEEIDALLQGLGQQQDGDVQDSGVKFGDLAARAAELALKNTELPAAFDRWEGDLVDVNQVREEQISLCGQMEITGVTRSRAQYYVDADSHLIIRTMLEAEEEGLTREALEGLMGSFAESMASQLAARGGGVVDIRSGPADSSEIGELPAAGERFRLVLWFSSDAGEWAVNLLISAELAGLHEVEDRSPEDPPGEDMRPEAAGERIGGGPTQGRSRKTRVDRAEFATLGSGSRSAAADHRIDMLLDVPLQVSVELGRTVCQIRDILQLGTGAVLELEKQAGDPVDILVNGKLVARGEVVVVDEDFAVRITEIVSLEERLKNLR